MFRNTVHACIPLLVQQQGHGCTPSGTAVLARRGGCMYRHNTVSVAEEQRVAVMRVNVRACGLMFTRELCSQHVSF